MDRDTAKTAFLLFDDYLDVCLGLTGKEHQDIYEKKKALKKELIHGECTEDEYITKDSELFLEYMQKVSKINMIYGKYILRIEETNDIYVFSTDGELIENTNILLTEFGINEKAININDIQSILNNKCDGVHLYLKTAG